MEELPVRFVRGNREVVEGVAPLVIGQRAGAVDAVFLCIFHVFAHPCPVYVAVRIRAEDRSLEFELDARPGTVNLHAGGIQVVFRLPVVVRLHVDLVEAEFAPVVMAAGVVERNPAERVVEPVEVVRDLGEQDVRTGQMVAVLRVVRLGGDLADPVEPGQVDVFVIALGEPRPHLVDVPPAGRYAVFVAVEIQPAPAEFSPVGRRGGRVDVVSVDDRIGDHHDHAAFAGRFAQPGGGLLDGLFQGVDTVALCEIVVDQLLPLLLAGRYARVAQHARHKRVGAAVGAVDILRFQEDEAVE